MEAGELKTIRSNVPKKYKSRDRFSKELGISTSTLQAWEEKRNPIPEWGSNLVRRTFPEYID